MTSLQSWFATPLGRLLAEAERSVLDPYLDRLSGWNLLQIGGFGEGVRVLRANTARQWLTNGPDTGAVDCRLRPEALPFQSATMDIVVLVHCLEFSENPHQVLREAERVLAADGTLLVLTFNLLSLWGLAHGLPGLRRRAPWCGDYYTGRRISDWARLLGLEVTEVEGCFYRPPINRERLQQHLRALERWGPRCLPWLSAVNLVVAQKRVAGLTPLRPAFRPKRKLVGGLVQPAPRNMSRN